MKAPWASIRSIGKTVITPSEHKIRDDSHTEALLGGLVESISSTAAHAAAAGERSDSVFTRLTLDARVSIQRTLVYVCKSHTYCRDVMHTYLSHHVDQVLLTVELGVGTRSSPPSDKTRPRS